MQFLRGKFWTSSGTTLLHHHEGSSLPSSTFSLSPRPLLSGVSFSFRSSFLFVFGPLLLQGCGASRPTSVSQLLARTLWALRLRSSTCPPTTLWAAFCWSSGVGMGLRRYREHVNYRCSWLMFDEPWYVKCSLRAVDQMEDFVGRFTGRGTDDGSVVCQSCCCLLNLFSARIQTATERSIDRQSFKCHSQHECKEHLHLCMCVNFLLATATEMEETRKKRRKLAFANIL